MTEEGFPFARYVRRFHMDDAAYRLVIFARTTGLHSRLEADGGIVATDWTPLLGPEAVRNHRLAVGDMEVEAGYISNWTTGIAVRRNGQLIHESHPGRTIAYPEKAARTISGHKGPVLEDGHDFGQLKRNRVPILVDILLGLLFYVVAKLTDLSTAALVGAAAGIALVIVQRFVKVDLLGGLALFGILLLLVSAGLALTFQDDMAVKMRSTIVGLLSAALFMADGLFGGNRLGKGLSRYLPYNDVDPGRLAVGMAILSFMMAGLNVVVARTFSTDVWLFYSTFGDFFLVMLMMMVVFSYARGQLFPKGYRRPPPPEAA